jgi:tetratricopeptide (TPR) repeat protein
MYIGVILILGTTFADYLFDKGDYFRAISEYKRDIFFRRDTIDPTAKISLSYYKLGQLEEAINWVSKAYYIDPLYKTDYEFMLCKAGKLGEAKILLSTKDISEKELQLKKIVNTFEQERNYWKTSFLIPGSGQVMSGEVWEGLLSFALNAGTLYLFCKRVEKKDFAGSLFSFSYFIRFYIGNISEAKKIERYKRNIGFQRNLDKVEREYLHHY